MLELQPYQLAIVLSVTILLAQGIRIFAAWRNKRPSSKVLIWLAFAIACALAVPWAWMQHTWVIDWATVFASQDPAVITGNIWLAVQEVFGFLTILFGLVKLVYDLVAKKLFEQLGWEPGL